MSPSTTSLTILHTGTVIVDEALPYHRDTDRPLAWTHLGRGRSRLVEAPVSCYLVEGPHGLVLIDTGWSVRNRTRRGQIANLRLQYPVNRPSSRPAWPFTSNWKSAASARATWIWCS